ncbi:MAG: Rpn family recombination-promoting nuclease/putative transposase [Saprospiraceae bacterium]|nr:Rpn family recombination-promoting nuclease/putative transposase [Saprospiraceae bacterium]
MHKLHDKFVRAAFSDAIRAAAFFEKFLPKNILEELDLQTLRPLQESYIQGNLKEYFSDIVFEVTEKNNDNKTDIVLLFEHKSSPDRFVLFQIGHYMFSHWYLCIQNKRPLKVIIPVIYYQGKKKWKCKPLFETFRKNKSKLQYFIPEIPHLFIALRSLSDDAISDIRDRLMAASVMAQKNAFDVIKLAEDLEKIFRLFPVNDNQRNFLNQIIVYVLSVSEIPRPEFEKALESIPEDIKENLMTTYSWIKEEGKLEGKLEGKTEEKIGVILKGFDKGLTISILAGITDLTEEDVQKILINYRKLKS